jgi:hypothetical protein
MDIDEAFALLAALELREVEDLDGAYFEAELQELLPLAWSLLRVARSRRTLGARGPTSSRMPGGS